MPGRLVQLPRPVTVALPAAGAGRRFRNAAKLMVVGTFLGMFLGLLIGGPSWGGAPPSNPAYQSGFPADLNGTRVARSSIALASR